MGIDDEWTQLSVCLFNAGESLYLSDFTGLEFDGSGAIALVGPSVESDLQVTKRAVAVGVIRAIARGVRNRVFSPEDALRLTDAVKNRVSLVERAIAQNIILMVALCDRSLDLAVVGYWEG